MGRRHHRFHLRQIHRIRRHPEAAESRFQRLDSGDLRRQQRTRSGGPAVAEADVQRPGSRIGYDRITPRRSVEPLLERIGSAVEHRPPLPPDHFERLPRLPPGEVVLLPQDSYYKDSSHVPVEERQNINFDHPDAFDWALLSRQVAMLRRGESIEQPTYSYLTCTRQKETLHIEPREVVIIEGILALCDKNLRDMMDLKIFVDADPDERLIRVIQRDVIERGRTAEAVMERYVRVLKPMHQQFIEPCKRYADLIVPEGGSNQIAIDILTMYIKKHLA